MTIRTLGLVSLSVSTILFLNEQAAYSSDTIWDLLRKGDPSKKGTTVFGKALGAGASAGQVIIDPKTGRQIIVPVQHVHKKRTGLWGWFDTMGTDLRHVGKQMNSDIHVSGDKKIGLHMESVSGNDETYTNDQYFGRKGVGGTYNDTDLVVTGKIGGLLNFTTHYTDRLYGNPNDNRVSLNYAGKHIKFDAGDIQAGITGNSLIDFSRSLKGIQLSTDIFRGLRLTGLYSQTKAQTRTIVLQGAGTSGPYYVFAGQVVDGSEHVRVNNIDMVKQTDYTLDPITGQLNFLKGRIIGPGETIAVTFETYGYNSQTGTLTGFRADLGMFKAAKFGVTMLSQVSPGANSTPPERTDQFPGYQDVNSPYGLLFPVDVIITNNANKQPVATPRYPMTVTVDGVPKVVGTDFVINPYLPNQIFMRVPYPPEAKILIKYTPVNDQQAGGNRQVMGADANFVLGKIGTITAEAANSVLDLASGKKGGTAMQIRGDMRFMKDKLTWNWNIRNIGENFTAIESPGFNRNEKGFTTGLNYSVSKDLKFTFNMEKSKRPSYDYGSLFGSSSSGYAATSGNDDYSQITFGANWQLGKRGSLNFNHNSMDTILSAGGKTVFGSDNLTANFTLGTFSMDFGVGRNISDSQFSQAATTGTTDTTASSTLTSLTNNAITEHVNLKWAPHERLSFTTSLSNSAIDNGAGQKTNAQDIAFNTNIVPMKNMQLTLGYQLQNSGGVSVLGTTGNTTTTAATSSNDTSSNSGDARKSVTRQTPVTDPYGGFGNSLGGSSGNYIGGGYNGNLGSYGNYSGGFYNSTSQYGAGSYGGNQRTLSLNWTYNPFQALNLNFAWNNSSSEGAYLYNSKRNDINLGATYNLGDRLSLSTTFGLQKTTYIGSTGGLNTNTLGFMVHSRPVGKLTADFNFMRMRSDSSQTDTSGTTDTTGTGTPTTGIPGTYTGGYVPTFGAFNTNMDSFGLRLEYPVYRGNSLFINYDTNSTSGYGASVATTLMTGINFDLGNHTIFTLGWRNQQHISKDSTLVGSNYSYRVSSLDAELGVHF